MFLNYIIVSYTGMIAGWRFLDHAAHFGGLLFGLLWIKEGVKLVDPFLKWYHKQREEIEKILKSE